MFLVINQIALHFLDLADEDDDIDDDDDDDNSTVDPAYDKIDPADCIRNGRSVSFVFETIQICT